MLLFNTINNCDRFYKKDKVFYRHLSCAKKTKKLLSAFYNKQFESETIANCHEEFELLVHATILNACFAIDKNSIRTEHKGGN